MELRKSAIFLQIGILIISSIINFTAFSKGYMPTPFQAFFSGLCVFTWFSYSLYNGCRNNSKYLIFCSLFWGIGLLLFVLGYLTKILFIGIPSIFFIAGALYGLKYIMNIGTDMILVIVNVSVSYLLMLFAFFLGKFFYRE